MPAQTQIADDARPRLARGVRLQIDRATGKAVLLYPEGIVELNETAREIIACCDGRSLGEIVSALAEQYDALVDKIRAQVRAALAELQQHKLIELT